MITAVIPVYNEEESLAQLHAELSEVAEQNNYDLEIVLIDDGKIAAYDALPDGQDEIIDATDKIVAPGLIDMHVHLREPGHEYVASLLATPRRHGELVRQIENGMQGGQEFERD